MRATVQEPEILDQDVGRCLRRLRKARNLFLASFAQRIGASYVDAQSYEDGTCLIPVHVFRNAADVLGVTMTDHVP